ncbi:glycosyltransferase family 2 protein [Reyranella soli]|uniref:Glycosyl transferase n=1 Tax=Reyranella soli TaxID=1230389 RepID=A0A512N3D3_9HYPH|nr:glycosyltransferase family 2 protein [Reyranella soli]GEP53101.1 glycosyl transferase [Reyranella soli]
MPLISVVVPMFNEAGNVGPMCEALRQMVDSTSGYEWEFVFVDDGSVDGTYKLLCDEHTRDRRIKIVQLSRNYGGAIADSAGLQFAAGDAAIVIAGDLQDHPREIPRLLEAWRDGEADVVWAVRATRDDPAMDRLFSGLFAKLIRVVALPNFPKTGSGGFVLLSRVVLLALNAFPERNRGVSALVLYSGFRQTQITYHRHRREIGKSKWSFRRKVRAAVDIIVSFSMLPLRIGSIAGVVCSVLAFILIVIQVVNRLIHGTEVPGLTQLSVLVLFLGGLQLLMLGVLGEYLWRTLDDTRRRPLFLVRQVHGDFLSYTPPLPPAHYTAPIDLLRSEKHRSTE